MAIEGMQVRRQNHDEDEYDRLEQYERLADLFDDDKVDDDEEDADDEDYGEEDE